MAKTFVVTGATSGIGLALAHALLPVAGRLVLVGRSEERLQVAVEALGRERHTAEVVPVRANLNTVADARALGSYLNQLPRIDALIHNAAILPTQLRLSPDGFEEAFAVNHLAAFVLNQMLEARLLASAPSRVVQVSAGLALGVSVDFDRDPRGADFDPVTTYAKTKLWNLLATLHWATTLEESGVTVNAVHPGVVRTRLGEGAPGVPPFEDRAQWLSPERGAQGPFHLATAAELSGKTARFFDQTREMAIRVPSSSRKLVFDETVKELEALQEHVS